MSSCLMGLGQDLRNAIDLKANCKNEADLSKTIKSLGYIAGKGIIL